MDITEARRYLQEMGATATYFAHALAGLNSGLFDAIARHGKAGVLPETLAQELGYFEDYVRVWCQASYTLKLLDHVGDGRFRLAEGFETLLIEDTPNSMVPMFRLRELMIEERMEYPEFMRTGAVRTYQDHGERLSRLNADMTGGERSRNRVEYIYKRIPEVTLKLQQGARVLEVGCGTGRLLHLLAQEFPETTFVGVDIDPYGIELGNSEVKTNGLAHRISLQQRGAESLDFRQEFDIVSLNLALHEIRADVRHQAVRGMWQALRPSGVLISNDIYYPSRLEDFRKPEHRFAVDDQATEVLWGNRHLTREEIADLFAACGFSRSEFHVIQFPGVPTPQLTSLAFR